MLLKLVLSLAHLSLLFGQFVRGLAAGARIFQIGNHSTLSKKKGVYWNLIKQQQANDDENMSERKSG
ncbi:hypothetical protein HNY73_000458 [Argiope bruennichi]|uniref:Secreted protein n=1 Tax=Argiope bruennichi TaxID=94029 RepID=A0A8T0G0R8_ARGBR|nr:hypothetical protein HNY73_000458 [Argiope bruennichi]